MVPPPLKLQRWIDEHAHLLKPPVGNKCLVSTDGYFVMVVGGPNSRSDFHYQPTEELFYQHKGAMLLSIIEEGQFRNITIDEGEMFLLPAYTPHCPRRFPDTVGLVLERTREEPGAFCFTNETLAAGTVRIGRHTLSPTWYARHSSKAHRYGTNCLDCSTNGRTMRASAAASADTQLVL